LCRSSVVQQQLRFRRIKPNKPHRPDWFRQKLLALSKPSWDEVVGGRVDEMAQSCNFVERENEKVEWEKHVNQLEQFYVKELREDFENSQMIGIFHTNPIAHCNFRKAWQNGRRLGMELKRFNIRVGRNCLAGTKWENCLQFWFSFPGDVLEQPIIFSKDVKAQQLIAFEKKVPEFFLVACVVHGRILSRAQVIEMVKMPDLSQQHSELVGLLGMNARKTTELLSASQTQLSVHLDQLIKDKS